MLGLSEEVQWHFLRLLQARSPFYSQTLIPDTSAPSIRYDLSREAQATSKQPNHCCHHLQIYLPSKAFFLQYLLSNKHQYSHIHQQQYTHLSIIMKINPSLSSVGSAIVLILAFCSSTATAKGLRCKKSDALLRVKYTLDKDGWDSIVPQGSPSTRPSVYVRPSGNVGKSTFVGATHYTSFDKLVD